MVPRVHSDKSAGVLQVDCNDTAARPRGSHGSLRGGAVRRHWVILGARRRGAPLLPAEFGPVVFPEDLRSVSVVETLETTAFYELTEVISQVRRAERLWNATYSKIYRGIRFGDGHVCFLFVTESSRASTYDVTNFFFFFFVLLLFSCPQLKVQQHHLRMQREVQLKRRLHVTTQKQEHVFDIKGSEGFRPLIF